MEREFGEEVRRREGAEELNRQLQDQLKVATDDTFCLKDTINSLSQQASAHNNGALSVGC